MVILSGTGIHTGLTWMYDGFLNKTVQRDKWIKIEGKTICRLKEAFEQAHAGNDEFFVPFHDAVYRSPIALALSELEKEMIDGTEILESSDEESED